MLGMDAMDNVALGVWRPTLRKRRRGADDVTVVELQQVVETWLNHVGGWGRTFQVVGSILDVLGSIFHVAGRTFDVC